jgi:hypothetical protein
MLLVTCIAVAAYSLYAFTTKGRGGFILCCESPNVTDVQLYHYKIQPILDRESAVGLIDAHFPDFVVDREEHESNGSRFWFWDPGGRLLAVGRDGLVNYKISEWMESVPLRHKFDYDGIEKEARDYMESRGFDADDLYLQSIGHVRSGGFFGGEQTGPCFSFGKIVGGLPSLGPDQFSVYFDVDERIVEFKFQESDVTAGGEEVQVLPLERCLAESWDQIAKEGEDKGMSRKVMDAEIAYHPDSGDLVPCWWITLKRRGHHSARRIAIDASSGDFLSITNWYS